MPVIHENISQHFFDVDVLLSGSAFHSSRQPAIWLFFCSVITYLGYFPRVGVIFWSANSCSWDGIAQFV
jgi:hypothetical protein